MRVLIVEDDREIAHFVQRGLKESGHGAEVAYDGDEGLDLALSGSFDAIIIDRMLPERDGLSVIQALRGAGVRSPVLILSALGEV
ncbi:MAG: response regulator, partial [Hyphomicrobiaceae bacterium]